MSDNKKKKESSEIQDSNDLPDDILAALSYASDEDEAEFLDALSMDVDEELKTHSRIDDSFLDFSDDVPDLGEEATMAQDFNDLPPEIDSKTEGESLVSFGDEASQAKSFDSLDEVSSLSGLSEDLGEAKSESEASVNDSIVDAVSKEGESSSNNDGTEFATMAISSVNTDEEILSPSNSGRNPLIDLKNADYIKFAQDKIKGLEKQLFDLRSECEELARAGDHFKSIADERGQKIKTLEAKVDEMSSLSSEEKKILQESISSKNLRIDTMQEHIENLEQELESRYNRVRERERDLEGRLEILKKEQSAVTKSKDEMILSLKSQNESVKSDLEKLRAQSQKVTSHLQEKEDALRRTMKALKLSLTMLESQNKD